MSGYPALHDYEILYARLCRKRHPRDLLRDLLVIRSRVLDLCAGGGWTSEVLLDLGAASCDLVDSCWDMLPKNPLPGMSLYNETVHSFLWNPHRVKYDLIICRQGVNYWLNEHLARVVAETIAPRGAFVFNTFSVKPPEEPACKTYRKDGRSYVETSWSVGDMVHHVQVAEGLAPHVTQFRYISPEEFRLILDPCFDVEVYEDGPTSIYHCFKRDSR